MSNREGFTDVRPNAARPRTDQAVRRIALSLLNPAGRGQRERTLKLAERKGFEPLRAFRL
jgi:hypothetical protein